MLYLADMALHLSRRLATLIPSARPIAAAMLAAAVALSACKSKTETEKVWIIPTFTTQDGHVISMGFNNPELPDMTLAECQTTMHKQVPRIIAEARAREPQRLATAKLTSIRCVAAVGDPLASEAQSEGAKSE
jgi:hypothetical protein